MLCLELFLSWPVEERLFVFVTIIVVLIKLFSLADGHRNFRIFSSLSNGVFSYNASRVLNVTAEMPKNSRSFLFREVAGFM